jgi:hypothetical protein
MFELNAEHQAIVKGMRECMLHDFKRDEVFWKMVELCPSVFILALNGGIIRVAWPVHIAPTIADLASVPCLTDGEYNMLRNHCHAKDKVAAIKALRAMRGMALKDAKDIVEAWFYEPDSDYGNSYWRLKRVQPDE